MSGLRTVLEHVKLVRIPHRRCGIFPPHPLSLTSEALFPQATRRGRTGDELTDDARDDEKAESAHAYRRSTQAET
ncbi:hypothetical protein FB107DRAFT_280413 [Schizophyllum commune]